MSYHLSYLNLATSILGFIVFILLIFSAKQNRFVNFFLGVGFLVSAYRSFSLFALEESLVNNTFIMGSISYIYYFIPVCIYIYFRAVINDEQSLKKTDWIHFLAPFLAIVLLIYYFTEGYLDTGTLSLPVNNSVFDNSTDLSFYIQPGVHALIIFILATIYVFFAWRLVFTKLMRNAKEHPQVTKMRGWILTLLITFSLLLLVLFFGGILKLIFNKDIIPLINPDIARSAILIFIFSRVLFKTDLLYGIPDLKTHLPIVDSVPVALEVVEPDSKQDTRPIESRYTDLEPATGEQELYFDRFGWIHMKEDDLSENVQSANPGSIEKDKVIVYINAINHYLEKAPYINPDFDIKSISSELQSPLYHIEYLFRYYNKYSFSEFRNAMRVQYVLDNFNKGLMKNYTLEAIGLKAGFSSRSSFFRVFKVVTGKTPKQVLDSMLAS